MGKPLPPFFSILEFSPSAISTSNVKPCATGTVPLKPHQSKDGLFSWKGSDSPLHSVENFVVSSPCFRWTVTWRFSRSMSAPWMVYAGVSTQQLNKSCINSNYTHPNLTANEEGTVLIQLDIDEVGLRRDGRDDLG